MAIQKIIIQLLISFMLLIHQSNVLAATSTVTYYVPDALGSPVAAMDEAGNVKWTKHYMPYGAEIESPASSEGNRIGYTGHAHDHDTGLTYMGARYYDPAIGRFLSIDPVGVSAENPDSFNRYAYANNNPYKYVDPDGREAILGLSRDIAEFQGRDMTEWDASHQQLGRVALGVVVVAGVAIVTEGTLGPTAATVLMTSTTGDAPVGIKMKANPLDGTSYTDKVKRQMEGKDLDHNFPSLIDKQADAANLKKITGRDGIERTKVELPGAINGKEGNFTWIIEPDKTVNHRQFERVKNK